jgi:hypothetical protein
MAAAFGKKNSPLFSIYFSARLVLEHPCHEKKFGEPIYWGGVVAIILKSSNLAPPFDKGY